MDKEKRNQYARKYYQENSERLKKYQRERRRQYRENDPDEYQKNKEISRSYSREYYMNNPEKNKKYYEKKKSQQGFREHRMEYNRKHRRELREKIIDHYSNGLSKCSCCGDPHFEFLELDHINGNGEIHRKEIKRTAGQAFYTWLIRNNYPEGYRVLCSNCNQSYGMYGYCPHQEEKKESQVFYINAIDPISFRDFVRRNPEVIIEAVTKDFRHGGPSRGLKS